MKIILLLVSALALSLGACRKEYVCVCTEKSTGDKNYGDRMKSGPVAKKAFQESCEANDDVFGSDLEDCHLE